MCVCEFVALPTCCPVVFSVDFWSFVAHIPTLSSGEVSFVFFFFFLFSEFFSSFVSSSFFAPWRLWSRLSRPETTVASFCLISCRITSSRDISAHWQRIFLCSETVDLGDRGRGEKKKKKRE